MKLYKCAKFHKQWIYGSYLKVIENDLKNRELGNGFGLFMHPKPTSFHHKVKTKVVQIKQLIQHVGK